ncbi:MAG: ATP-binding protein [Nocardioides sp.]
MTPARLPLRIRVAAAFALATAVALTGLGMFLHVRVASTLEAQAVGGVAARLDALQRLPEDARASAVEDLTGEAFAQVLDREGAVVATSPQLRDPLLTPGRLPAVGATTQVEADVFLTIEGESAPALMRALGEEGQVLVVGTSSEDVAEALANLRAQLLVGGPLALLLATALGYVVAGAALRPMERMRARASTISADSSGDRLPLPAVRDEVHRLGRTLNDMLDRLDAGLRRERRFVAEASHELRTPLAVLRTELDLLASRERSPEETRVALASMGEEVDRLALLVHHLLLLASADDAGLRLDRTTFDVTGLLSEVAARFAPSSEDRAVVVAPSPWVEVTADRRRLDQVLSNLVDNAIRHGEGTVSLAAAREPAGVAVTVSDEGGTALDDELFERFRQGSGSRAGGRGLGLALVSTIVSEHGGTVVAEVRDGRTEVRILLPREPAVSG